MLTCILIDAETKVDDIQVFLRFRTFLRFSNLFWPNGLFKAY